MDMMTMFVLLASSGEREDMTTRIPLESVACVRGRSRIFFSLSEVDVCLGQSVPVPAYF